MNFIDRKQRDMILITDTNKKNLIISKYLNKKEMQIKKLKTESIVIKDYNEPGNQLLIKSSNLISFKEGEKVSFFKVLGRYVQLDCVVLQEKGEQNYLLKIENLHLAHKDREDYRIVPPDDAVWVTNVRTSRTNLTTAFETVPTVVKINYSDYENKLRSKFEYIKIDIFRPGMDLKFELVKKTGKILFVHDTQDIDSYLSMDVDYLNYGEELGEEFQKVMNDYKDKRVVSEVIIPVIYYSPESITASTIGYVHIQSKNEKILMDQVLETKVLTFEMIDRIRESNTIIKYNKFPVLNISYGGLRILITDKELAEHLPHQMSFSFDIVFKNIAPMSMNAHIKYLSIDSLKNLIVGVQLYGLSHKPRDKKKYAECVGVLKTKILEDK
ncbi:MAG: DUF1577 domain-containing protein [Leptospiraceae bacterium]|nr:DUF1577 domain-containing protein [Leptospiraceae bacterium]MCP5493512.1 DUF1577 domain-containing protein [Leptospiraceae bacterium]